MKTRYWFVLAFLVVIVILAVKGKVTVPPAPPKPAEFKPSYPGPKQTDDESYDSFIRSFDPVIYGIIDNPIAVQKRLDKLEPIITKAAKKCGIDPLELRAVLYLEGQGELDKVSGASCAGVAQFYPPTARSYGLKVSKSWRTFYRAYKAEKNPLRKAKKWAKLQKYDERFDPRKAIPASARYLGQMKKKYGDIEKAYLAGYHMGEPNLDRALENYRSGWDCPETFSWMELVLDASPDRHPMTYRFLHDKLDDESWSYCFRVEDARKAAIFWKKNRRAFMDLVYFYDDAESRGRRPRLAHEFIWYQDEMKKIPELVGLSSRHTNVVVDPGVSNPELTPSMAGMLYYLAKDIEARGGESIRVTSAYRTFKQQDELVRQGRSPSVFTSHRAASGMDLGIPQDKKTNDLLEWGLMVLRAKGDIIWYKERSHFHVTINPKSDYFASIPVALKDYLKKSETYDQWAEKYGDLKPVGFWEGFWGRIFSWPWLLVLAIGLYLSIRYEKTGDTNRRIR